MNARRLTRMLPVAGLALAAFATPAWASGDAPGIVWSAPFAILLLCVAILPLISATEHWWHKNSSKLLVGAVLAVITLGHYMWIHGYHGEEPGVDSVLGVLHHAVVLEYIPFIALLFSLYTIAGGIELSGDLKAHPRTNTIFIGVGAAIASFVGTTGAAMLLIRPLLRTNRERQNVVHTVVFFIFAVCNCGGLLLPVGDPPLFLGYLKGVPFTWTLVLWKEFLVVNAVLLVTYYIWDTRQYKLEKPQDIIADTTQIEPLRLRGGLNMLLLLGVVLCVALLDPSKQVPGTTFTPPMFMREALMFGLCAISYFVPLFTPKGLRRRASFDFFAITEVAVLFIGIFITMQVPIEILNAGGGEALGVDTPMEFFWFTGVLSSCLDNAPTYVVFFEVAKGLDAATAAAYGSVLELPGGAQISELLLTAISCGAVFLGAMTYIGNGPNFLVKAIAEQSGVKMPSFFGYMKYSIGILVPIFVVVSMIWFL
jgi:Na+/H+ antiporter NhaD/arsenite permease-like protein